MMTTRKIVGVCQFCDEVVRQPQSSVRRAIREGKPLYCNRVCFGMARRVSLAQKKKSKSVYDARRRVEKATELSAHPPLSLLKNGNRNMIDLTGRHPATIAAMRLFQYGHLPAHLQHVSALFASLAETLVGMLPDDQLLTTALNNLWDAKNRAVMLAVLTAERK